MKITGHKSNYTFAKISQFFINLEIQVLNAVKRIFKFIEDKPDLF